MPAFYDDYDLYNLYNFYSFWEGLANEHRTPQPAYAVRPQEPPPLPAPPATLVIREYHWPEQVGAPPAFSIVTTGGTVYLATLVWVEGDNLHFNSVDGGVRQIPRSSVSRALTQAANAQKHLNLPLP
jgi:hypothetical protein